MKAAIYARLSVDDGENTSIDTQLRVCRERAKAEGWPVVATYADANVSGGIPPHLRPEGARLVAARDAHEFDVLIVSEPTRLYRSDALPAELRRWAAERVRVVFVGGEINMEDDEWELSAGIHGIMGQAFRRMISKKTHAALASRALRKSWTGGRPYGYDLSEIAAEKRKVLVVNEAQAVIVREIFARYIKGASCTDIARDLNKRGVPSPGSTWSGRKVRRCSGWIDTAVRVILQNPIYTGTVRWNTSKWKLDEKTGTMARSERPQAQWEQYTYHEEAYRIVTDELWQSAEARLKDLSRPDPRLKSGGKAVYRLSGLLKCGTCGRNYVVDSGTHYACPSSKNGACTNTIRQRRDEAERYILGAIDAQLLDETMVKAMAAEIVRDLNKRATALASRSADKPAELTALEARIARLKSRLRQGDPDMTADEIQVAIDRAEAKRAELTATQPTAKATAQILTTLPKAAAAYRAMIASGISKRPEAAARARAAVRRLVGGEIKLVPKTAPDGGKYLEANFGLNRIALFSGTYDARRFSGSGGMLRSHKSLIELR
jgi:site-specific DNA recombinase